jgi:murein DD-endopeptidase MepM/ murein hydrolase activator NlpD
MTRFEGEKPVFEIERPVETIGQSYTLTGSASDQKSGLRRVWIAVFQEGKEIPLFDESYPSTGLLRKGAVPEASVSVEIKTDELGLSDGEALLRIAVWDHAYRGWWSGNRTYEEKKILIDTRPPVVEVITRVHNLNQGGAGLAVYRVSEPDTVNGVQVADVFFPGHAAGADHPDRYVAFFAIPFDKGPDVELYVTATDRAGNAQRRGFPHHINARSFKTDSITISDAFLRQKMPEFQEAINPSGKPMSLIDQFKAVNHDLRKTNYQTINAACGNSDAAMHWDQSFVRLPHSARRAGFADHRKYVYNGKLVDEGTHLGIDLASTAHAPVPAANAGRVALAEYVGIYGNTVLLDHGFGLFSMYGHLSRMTVERNQGVSRGETIGYTGATGLAGGDHLHYSVIVAGRFVNPVEWWDPNWIRNNITVKREQIN